MKRNPIWIACVLAGILAVATAATLSYSPAAPQSDDTEAVIAHKQAVAATTIATNTTTSLAGCSYKNITTATTTAVKATPGVLERIIVNSAGAGSTLTIYDSATGAGTTIGTWTTAAQGSFTINAAFGTALTVVSASGTPADITVIYR